MYVGPFFYLDHPRISRKGLVADLCPPEKAEIKDRKRISPVSHEDLLARIDRGVAVQDIPRGLVAYDETTQQAIVYLDRCIERNVDEIVALFELPAWVVEYDERFVCPRCEHLQDLF